MRFRALTLVLCSAATAAACSSDLLQEAGVDNPTEAGAGDGAPGADGAANDGATGSDGAPLGDGGGSDAGKDAAGDAAADADAAAPPPYVHYDINHVLSTGASDSVANGASAFLTTTQPFGNLQFDTGVMTAGNCNGSGCTVYQTPAAFAPLVEGDKFFNYGVETISSGLGRE